MKENHLTLRLPAALDRQLLKWARARGVPKSHVVREAVAQYLAPSSEEPPRVTARELARSWRTLPRLTAEEAHDFGRDIASAREELPAPRDPWA